MARRLDRRAFLLGSGAAILGAGGAFVLIDQGLLPGRLALHRALGACDVGGPLPAVTPGPVATASFASAARGVDVTVRTVYPPGARRGDHLPVCVFLHGHGSDSRFAVGAAVGLPWLLADAVRAGTPPFAIVGVDGGSGYWHGRTSGDDAGAMVADELLPRLEAAGLETARIALAGVSMGGYGALLHAERLGAGRVAAVGAMSPALWQHASDTVAGAFDGAADFAAHDVFAGRRALGSIPTRIDCGRDDPFAPACEAFLTGAPASVTGALHDGCHDAAFWRSVAPDHLRRIGAALDGA